MSGQPKEVSTFRVDHDTDAMNIIDMVNGALREIGAPYVVEDDNLFHDGFILYSVHKTKEV